MRLAIALGLLALTALTSCSKPNPYDAVRKFRREYIVELQDYLVTKNSDEVRYIVKIQNKSGGKNLQDITVVAEALDGDEKPFWSETKEIDLSEVGEYVTKSFNYTATIPGSQEKLQFFNVRIAPDLSDEEAAKLSEFQRVTK